MVSHLLFGYVLSIMSVFGIVALTGVVVNDAIVFIERINENLAEGMRFKDAVAGAGSGPSFSRPSAPWAGWAP